MAITHKLLAWFVLLLGLVFSGTFGYLIKVDSDVKTQQQFVLQCEEIKLKINTRLKAHEQLLLSSAAMFSTSQEVTRNDWHRYVDYLRVNEHFNGIQGLGFSIWLPYQHSSAHHKKIRAEGFPNYKIYPEGKREFYSSIILLEPFDQRNQRAFGYDMYTEPVRRTAMIKARDFNQASLSGRVTLVQEINKQRIQAGTLMYVPVYQKQQVIDTVDQRRKALVGWVYSPFRMTDLLNNIVSFEKNSQQKQIRLRIYDGDNTKAEQLLYDSNDQPFFEQQPIETYNIKLAYKFNGTPWTLEFTQISDSYLLKYRNAELLFIAGCLISILLFLYLMTRINAAATAIRLSTQLRESENRFRLLADFAPVLIWLSNTKQGYYHFNKTWLDFTGHSLTEEQHGAWLNAIHPNDINYYLQSSHNAFHAQSAFTLEYRLRRHNGQYRWLLNTGIPHFSESHEFLGYIGSCIDITERKLTEQELIKNRQQLQNIITATNVGTWEWNVQTGEVVFNERWANIIGYTLAELQPISIQTWIDFCHPEDLQHSNELLNKHFSGELDYYDCECRMKHKQEHWIWVSDHGRLISYTEEGKPLLMAGTHVDITERKHAQIELGIAATIFESQEGMMVTDKNGIILKVNHAFCEITGYPANEVIGQNLSCLKSDRHDHAFYNALWQRIYETGSWQGELWSRRKNGEIYPQWLTITAVIANKAVTHYVATLTDITERKATEEYINHLAFYDSLTQLPNRRLLHEHIKHGIEVANRSRKQMAVLMLDLDKFKPVNDNLGHAAGDELLKQVAQRINARLRKEDMVARLGGDEFVIIIENISYHEHVTRIANEIIHILFQPFILYDRHEVYIGTSIGIALYPDHANNIEGLIDNADAALYHAKARGRGCFAYFSEQLTEQARERIALETHLRHAVEYEQLRVFFQPQVNIDNGQITGAEALVRWHHPVHGYITPKDFIALAEETGLIANIGEWVLYETCRLGKQWLDQGLPPILLAVNISPYQFRRCDINRLVANALEKTAFPANYLELEITETGLIENKNQALSILNQLRDQGVHIAIDDFGTGYSSLSYLKHLPLDVLKIDKTFIDDISVGSNDIAIASTIIAMARHLGFKVLAEGVETEEQLKFLQQQGCNLYQGHLYSKAISAEDFSNLLKSYNTSTC